MVATVDVMVSFPMSMREAAVTRQILIVEDDPAFLYAATKALHDAGFEVVSASDYQNALAVLTDSKSVELLLTDLVMPKGINGIALARMAKLRRPDLKVLYMTGFDIPDVQTEGKILRKPLTDGQLVDEVKQALGEKS